MAVNQNNVDFIETIFAGDVAKDFPSYNYRLRLAGLTEFEPYISEAPQFEDESDENYNARVLTSGRYFGEQEIIIDDIVHSDQNILGLEINSQYLDGRIPRTLLFLEKCKLINEGKEYQVESKNLNDLGCVNHEKPFITFPVDGISVDSNGNSNKGYLVYRKTTTVHKHNNSSNGALLSIASGWNEVSGLSSADIISSLNDAGSNIADRIKAAGFVDENTESVGGQLTYKGYEPFENELFTEYKVLDSGSLNSAGTTNELTNRRVVDIKVDDNESYSLERKVTRESNSESNPADWETIEHNVSFPYNDDEDLTDFIQSNIDFNVSGVYETVETTGEYATSNDFFEINFVDDWGKSKYNEYGDDLNTNNFPKVSNRQKSDYLTFRNGESVKVNQRSTLRRLGGGDNPSAYNYSQYNSLDLSFSPLSTGKNGFLTGDGNDKNFYELEYQFVPNTNNSKKLYYEVGGNVSVGSEVFYNTGYNVIDGKNVYSPVQRGFLGETPEIVSAENISENQVAEETLDSADLGPSYLINVNNELKPDSVPESEVSGVGYSYFTSGEKYMVVPKGGYNTASSNTKFDYYSAGETFKNFFQGEQSDDLSAEYALTEYRTFDDAASTEEIFYAKNDKSIRIGEKAICLGDSCSELNDVFLVGQYSYILDPIRKEHKVTQTLTNGSVLNIDGTDGSVKISNLKNNRQQFSEKSNLFFEKNYVASLAVMANGEKQNIDALKQFIEDDKVYYLERDIYIDSSPDSQANSNSPIFKSTNARESQNPFSTNANTPNRESLGQEKLYVTQTYHKESFKNPNYPFSDYDYYNLQPSVAEEFVYTNTSQNIIDDFTFSNTRTAGAYRPGNFEATISKHEKEVIQPTNGYSILVYGGTKITPSSVNASSKTITVANGSLDQGSYYQIQHRTNANSDWVTVSHAYEALSEAETVIELNTVEAADISFGAATTNYRLLRWFPSQVMNTFDQVAVPCESPDSLILKAGASNRFYDISKNYHTVKKEGTVTSDSISWGSGNIYQMVFNGSASNYLEVDSSRAFDIPKGEFSFEFWIKDNSAAGIIIERENAYKVYMSSSTNLKVDFLGNEVISHSIESTSSFKHIAIAKVLRKDSDGNPEFSIELYIDGQKELSKSCNYDDYVTGFNGKNNLVIGKSLNAIIVQPRIYMGASLFKNNFTVTEADFAEEPNPIKYKILKFNYNRRVETGSEWIINRNSFDNLSVPDDYVVPNESDHPFRTKHAYEWLQNESENQSNSRRRALVKYFNEYAFRAPNNPHINKNYEGTPVNKNFNITADNYAFTTRETNKQVGNPFRDAASPYYYEYLENSSITDVRLSSKGGKDTKSIPKHSSFNSSYSNASRLRVTKYVYRLYTKDALIVSDTGYKGSRSSQNGWTYQLQYSVDSGSNWTDVDATESYQDYIIFNENDFSSSSNPADNIDHKFILPMLVTKTDITSKYNPEDIEFRVEKRQVLSISSDNPAFDVYKQYNFLPLEVNIPTKNTLLDITKKDQNDADSLQDSNYTVTDNTNQAEVFLDPDETYVLVKNSNEKILASSDTTDEIKINSISVNDTFLDETVGSSDSQASLEDDKPYEFTNLTGLRIYNPSSTINNKSSISTVIGVKPSGLGITRLEKSFNEIESGQSGVYSAASTKVFITPSITGSHFEALDDFQIYTANNSQAEDTLLSFSCSSFVTGTDNQTIETGVSGVSYKPVHDFHNNPYITGAYSINADDEGKTFLVSGSNASLTFEGGHDYSLEIANIGSNNISSFNAGKVSQVNVGSNGAATVASSSDLETIEPSVDNEGDFVILEDFANHSDLVQSAAKLNGSAISQDTAIVNISTGDCSLVGLGAQNHTLGGLSGVAYNSSKVRKSNIDSGVVVLDHESVHLTPNDAGGTVFIDTDSKVYLPSGFSNTNNVTVVNSTNHQLEVLPESGFKIEGNGIDYIPKGSARKFTCSWVNDPGVKAKSWSSEDIEVVSFSQLAVTNSNNNEVFIHNEDVDIRINSSSIQAGQFAFSLVRSQVESMDYKIKSQYKTPLIRVFVDDVLKQVSKTGQTGMRVSYQSIGWVFDDIPVLESKSVIITPESNGKVFLTDGEQRFEDASGSSIGLEFEDSDKYTLDFEVFVIPLVDIDDFTVFPQSSNKAIKFEGIEGDVSEGYTTRLLRDDTIRIYRGNANQGSEVNKFQFETVSKSSIEKITHTSSNDKIFINYKESTTFELPVLDSNFSKSHDFKLAVVNVSNTPASLKYPKQALSKNINQDEEGEPVINDIEKAYIDSFGYLSCEYDDQLDVSNDYQKFVGLDGPDPFADILTTPNLIEDGDVMIFDGSSANLNIKKFLGDEIRTDKYSSNTRASRIESLGSSNKFKLINHGFVNKQKITFDCSRLTIIDYYLELDGVTWTPDSWNGQIKSGVTISTGDTLLVFNGSRYFLYKDDGDDGTGNRSLSAEAISFSTASSDAALVEFATDGFSTNQREKLFVYINKDSGKRDSSGYAAIASNAVQGKVLDLVGGKLSTKTPLAAGVSIATNLSFSADKKRQSYFIEIINENEFKLCVEETLATEITATSAGDFKFLSEFFNVEDSESGSITLVNLSSSSIQPKDFSHEENAGTALGTNKYNDYVLNKQGVYSNSDAAVSGVYIASGFNCDDSSDTLDIDSIAGSQVIASGTFHAKGNLDNSNFDNQYYVNAGLSKLEITNTADSERDTLSKNRVFKHDSNGTFTPQDLNDSSNRDVIYYPKNEIHILNRKNLGLNKGQNQFDYNFVIYNYEGENNENEEIILPNSWSNLGKVAVVNVSDLPVTVYSFDKDHTATVNAQSVLYIDNEAFSSSSPQNLKVEEDVFTQGDYTFTVSDLTCIIEKAGKEDSFIVSKTGQIILDHTVHNDKTLFVERDTYFVRPYLYNGSTGAKYTFNGTSIGTNFEFKLVNISFSKVLLEGFDEEIYSKKTYSMRTISAEELEEYYDPDAIDFSLIEIVSGAQLTVDYPETNIDSDYDYHVFGKELKLSLDFKYRSLNQSEQNEIDLLGLSEDADSSAFYRLEGIIEENLSKLNVINISYDNVKIKSVSVKHKDSGEEIAGLNDLILNYLKPDTENDSFGETDFNSDSQEVGVLNQTNVEEPYIAKDEVLRVSVRDIVESVDVDDATPQIFDADLNQIESNPNDGVFFNAELLSVSKSKVRYFKKYIEKIEGINSLEAFSYPAEVYIPPAGSIQENSSFTVVNSSRGDITLKSSDGRNLNGSSSSLTITKGTAKKISFNKSSLAFSDVSGTITVTTVGSSISALDGGIFVANQVNSASSPLIFDPALNDLKVVNNSGAILYIEHKDKASGKTVAGSSAYQLPNNTFIDLIVNPTDNNFEVSNLNKDIALTFLADGAVISKDLYENKVVCFDAKNISVISFDSKAFFNTTLVPFIRLNEYLSESSFTDTDTAMPKLRLGTVDVRASQDEIVTSGDGDTFYSISNTSGSRHKTQSFAPVSVSSSGFGASKLPSCHIGEFLLDTSVNNKVILTSKYYKYLFSNSATTSFSIYCRNDEGVEFYNMRRLDSKGQLFNDGNQLVGPADEADAGVQTKIALSCSQSGASDPTITELNTYNDIFHSNILYKKAYLNKSFYANKIIVFNQPYELMYDSSSAVNLAAVNISDEPAYVFKNKRTAADEDSATYILKTNKAIIKYHETSYNVSRPVHSISSNSKTHIITQPADITYTGTYPLNIINSSSKNVNITVGGKVKKLYFGEKATYSSADNVAYRTCPGYNRKDWFLKLSDSEIVHLERDLDYYDDQEREIENVLRKPVMIDYKSAKYRFSNFFQTNLYEPGDNLSGYETIEKYNVFYKYGIKIYGDKKNQVENVSFDTDPISYITSGLKLSWNMPKKVLAYSMRTGHERLVFCKEFNQRDGSITFSGIESGKYYALDDFEETDLNFVSSSKRTKSELYGEYKYQGTSELRNFQPSVTYNGQTYFAGQKFLGVSGKSDYKVSHPKFGILKASQFNLAHLEQDIKDESEFRSETLNSINTEISTSSNVTPGWSVIESQDNKKDFLTGKVEEVFANNSEVEMLLGRKLSDIDGIYDFDEIIEENDEGEEVEKKRREGYFEFRIPKDAVAGNYTINLADVDAKGEQILSIFKQTDDEFVFRFKFGQGVDYPGYEYQIKSSLKFTNTTQKHIYRLSFSSQDKLAFKPSGSIKSLNLNFSTDYHQDSNIVTSTANSSASEGSFSRRAALVESNRILSLKNNIGYSFVPFNKFEDGILNKLYGMSFMAEADKRRYKAVRLRLKKLSKREITFEDLKQDRKIGNYLTNNSEQALLQYNLDTEVDSITYHDIAKPGGVLKSSADWYTLSSSTDSNAYVNGNDIKLDGASVSNGDAIALVKNGNQQEVNVYFAARVTASVSGHRRFVTFKLLKIYEQSDTLLAENTVSVAANDYIKVLNYFDLSTVEDGTFRQIPSQLPRIYGKEPDTSLDYPIMVANQTFYLECPRTESGDEKEDPWGINIVNNNKIRANFELSTIAKYWNGETETGRQWQLTDRKILMIGNNVSTHWVNFDIFESNKNLLYRGTTQIERVSYSGNEYTYNVKLNTNIPYRYVYKKNTYIKSVGSLSADTVSEFYNTNENLVIVVTGQDNEAARKELIYQNICLVEGTDYIDLSPHKTGTAAFDENIAQVDYLDYQIPSLNSDESIGSDFTVFRNSDHSYFTEGHDGIRSYSQKAENLTSNESVQPIGASSFKAGLFYDLGMPAICKYIYAEYAGEKSLGFSITDFWDGFLHRFGGENEFYTVRPKEIHYKVQSYNGSTWSDLEGEDSLTDRVFKVVTKSVLSSSTKYRLAIQKVVIEHKNPDAPGMTTSEIDYVRLPFKWTSIIKDSDLGASVNSKYTQNLIENHLIGKSVSFPEDGITKFGEFSYLRDGLPYYRLYIFNLKHNLRASYKDPINRGGISKVIITDKGKNYRTPPTITINPPEDNSGNTATARAIIESGKIKFIEVVNNGSGYVDLAKDKQKRIEQSRISSTPFITQTTSIRAKNKSLADRGVDYEQGVSAAFSGQEALKSIGVTVTPNESSLPTRNQEEFGLTFEETEAIANSVKGTEISTNNSLPKVDFMVGSSEDDETWSDIQAQADRIQGISNFVNETIKELKESDSYGDAYVDDQLRDLGTEDANINGMYKEHQTDKSKGGFIKSTIKFDIDGNITDVVQFESYPDVENGSAVAVANNSSVAEYRVINNRVAAKTTPWFSSFSREDNPNLPQSFGLIPGSPVSSEVFNSYARAVNFMHKIRVEAPIFARITRYKQIEYRYIDNPIMAGLTFANEPTDIASIDSGDREFSFGHDGFESNSSTFSYLTYEKKSKVNFITYFDPSDSQVKKAYFSGFTTDGSDTTEGKNIELAENNGIWDDDEDKPLSDDFKVEDENDSPSDIGLPNIVNISTDVGVYCNPPDFYQPHNSSASIPIKGDGIPLPTTINKRAWAYGGEIVSHAISSIYDVSDDTAPFKAYNKDNRQVGTEYGEIHVEDFPAVESDLVNIRGGDWIRAGYTNQIVFGCQTNGKPFFSAFLKTTKVWTEYEVVSNPEFTETLPEGIRDKYKPEESKLRCNLTTKQVNCSNEKIGKVSKNEGYHSICRAGGKTFQIQNSYEDVFNLSEGDDVIGPKTIVNEFSELVQSAAKGVLKVEPEFNLALAVYSSNKFVKDINKGIHNPNSYIGPCEHHCMPGEIKTLTLTEDPLIFDLKK